MFSGHLCLPIATVLLLVAPARPSCAALNWERLPDLPDRIGLAGSYVGVSGGALLVAGGANFPDKRPWDGGEKVWHDRIVALAADATTWRDAGRLPEPAGYGVSLTLDDGLLLIGGGNAKRNFPEVRLLRWDGRALAIQAWPPLPRPLALAAGAIVGRTVYVAGGIDQPDARRAQRVFYALDLDAMAAGWRALEPCPGAERILATAAAHDGAFYLFGGARLVTDAAGASAREQLRDAWRYTPAAGWKRLADLPHSVVAAPSPAPEVGGKLLILGGDDGTQVDLPPAAHRGFSRDVLAYDPAADRWSRFGEMPFSFVTTPVTHWRSRIVLAGGEIHPGIRSPAVWRTTAKQTPRPPAP